jgi:glycerol-3-phosphate acyltransferase PlsY
MRIVSVLTILLTAYGLGCFCFGYYLVRWRLGQDVRHSGSGSVGATNVGRVLGGGGFLLTLLADGAKGAVVVFLTRKFDLPSWVVLAGMIAVVTGHLYPVQLGFCGGKGVATLSGCALLYDWRLIPVLCIPFLLLWLLTRRYQLGGLGAIALSPIAAWLLYCSPEVTTAFTVLALLILWAHVPNLRRGHIKSVKSE